MRFLALVLALCSAATCMAQSDPIQINGPMSYTVNIGGWIGSGELNNDFNALRVYFRTQPKGTLVIRSEASGEYHIFNLSTIEYGQPLNVFIDEGSYGWAPWTFIISGKVDGLYFSNYPTNDNYGPILTGAGHVEYTLVRLIGGG